MKIDSKIVEAILKDSELAARLEQAWHNGAATQELVDILGNAGVEVEASEVEEITAQLQAKRGESIAVQELDEYELEQVAGGGDGKCDGTGDCDGSFKMHPEVKREDRCTYTRYCDDYYGIL